MPLYPAGGGSGTPGGSDTQVQFNDGGAFGGDAGLVYNKTTDALTLGGLLTLTGGQIKFPATQSASADANTLDDYEEGDWTPVIGGSGGTSGQAYANQVGKYSKIGRLVVVTFHAELSTEGTITGNVQIQGLPFSYGNSPQLATLLTWHGLATNQSFVFGHPSGTAMTVYGIAAAGTTAFPTPLTAADIGDSSQFRGFLCYHV